MNQITILFDYDDVLFPLLPSWIQALNDTHGTEVRPEDITEWDMTKFFPTLTKEQIYEPIYLESFWRKLKPIEGAVESLQNLVEKGYKVKVVTATSYHNIKPKAEILLKYFPFLSWEDVHVTSDKQSVKGFVLVDDNPANLIGGEYRKILMNAPHNQNVDKEEDIHRAFGVVEACDIIENLVEKEMKIRQILLTGIENLKPVRYNGENKKSIGSICDREPKHEQLSFLNGEL